MRKGQVITFLSGNLPTLSQVHIIHGKFSLMIYYLLGVWSKTLTLEVYDLEIHECAEVYTSVTLLIDGLPSKNCAVAVSLLK